jgi:hypothetical protein
VIFTGIVCIFRTKFESLYPGRSLRDIIEAKMTKKTELADIDAIRTFWKTSEEGFYIPNYL